MPWPQAPRNGASMAHLLLLLLAAFATGVASRALTGTTDVPLDSFRADVLQGGPHRDSRNLLQAGEEVGRYYCGTAPQPDPYTSATWTPFNATTLPSGGGGFLTATPISLSDGLQFVYQTACTNPLLRVRVQVPTAGNYLVTVLFAEPYWTTPGRRVFDVTAEGLLLLDNMDIVAKAGAPYTANNQSFVISTPDTALALTMTAVLDQATFSGIIVESAPDAPAPPAAGYGINVYCESLNFTDTAGTRWSPIRGSPYVASGPGPGRLYPGAIADAGPLLRVYRSECIGTTSVVFPVPQNNSIYAVTIYFSENYWEAAGKRVFSVLLESKVVLPFYDIFAEVGLHAAAFKTFYVNITDGDILVNWVNHVDQAHFSGISVSLFSSDPNAPIPPPPVPLPSPPPVSPPLPPPPGASPPPTVRSPDSVFQMYCGAGTFIDGYNRPWADRTAFELAPGPMFGIVTTAIDGAPPELLDIYQSECAAPTMALGIEVPEAGEYDVTIMNSENWFTEAGGRVFDVAIEGNVVLADLDLFAVAGGQFKAVNHTFRVTVDDGFLNITMTASINQARFGGIFVNSTKVNVPAASPVLPPPISPEPSPVPSPDVLSPAVATWCGDTEVTDAEGIVWQPRAYFVGAGYTAVYPGGIVNATDDLRPIYAAECVGPDYRAVFTDLLPGTYTVSILAAETYFTTAASRVFSVYIQGTQVLSAVDLVKDYGALTAATISYVVPSVTSTITLRFVASVDQARIGGIVVTPGARFGVPVITPAPAPAPLPPPPPSGGGIIPPIKPPTDPSAPALNLNYNGAAFTDAQGNNWVPATPYVDQCAAGNTGTAILGAPATLNDMLQTECFGPITTTIPVQNTGTYTVRLWNAEIYFDTPGSRKFDVIIQGIRLVTEWDVLAEAGGKFTATYKEITFTVTAADIKIELRPVPGFDFPSIKGLQLIYVSSSTLSVQATPSSYSFQLVDPVNPINNKRDVVFTALLPTGITGIRVQKLQPAVFPDQSVFVFNVTTPTTALVNSVDTAVNTRISYDPALPLARGQTLSVEGTFLPRDTNFYACRLEIMAGVTVVGAITFDGTGDTEANVAHVLHVVADGSRFLVDVNGAGALPVTFDATPSHTHDPARRITGYRWADASGTTLSTARNVTRTLAPGAYGWNLTISDDGTPPSSKSDVINFNIYPPTAVPGTFAKFYLGTTAANLTSDLTDALPSAAACMPGFWLVAPLPSRVSNKAALVVLKGSHVFTAGTTLTVTSGTTPTVPNAIYVNGTRLAAGEPVPTGFVNVELRLFVTNLDSLPVQLLANGVLLGQTATVYNEAAESPVINQLSPTDGIVLGGTRVTVQGFAWRMSDVSVRVGDTVVPNGDLTQLSANSFYFFAPPAPGPSGVTITVTSKGKSSNSFTYNYLAADQPVPNFRQTPFTWAGTFAGITCGQWCHGRYFFSGASGYLYEVAFNDDHTEMTNVTRYEALTQNPEVDGVLVLGLACNPLEPAERFRIYLAHSDMFDPVQDPTGEAFQGISEYSATVGYFQWPEMDKYHIVINQLPCATAFHSVASLGFDNKGLLYVGVGANTNTGAPAPRFGNLAENPWSSGMLRADVMNPNFKGRIQYEFRPDMPAGASVNANPMDQQNGLWVRTVASSTRGMEMFAYGLRNPLGLTWHTNGNLYVCDNGPNADSGPALLGPSNYSTEYVGSGYDRIDIIERFSYYGIGNENRALQGDIRQGTYIAREPSDKYYRPSFSGVVDGVPVNYTQPIGLVLSSSNGMDEYRSNTFLGAMRGWLLISKLATFMYFVKLTPDGQGVEEIYRDTELNLPQVPSLKTITGPGGHIVGIDFDSNSLRVLSPVDTARDVAGLTYIYDIFPWRTPKNIPANATYPFVISGANFANLEAPVVVRFGDDGPVATGAVVTGASTIKGKVPAYPTAPNTLIDIIITTGAGSTYRLTKAFRYLDDYSVQLDAGPRW